jgi:hypothetical protein
MSWGTWATLMFCALTVSGDRSAHIGPSPPLDICTSEGILKNSVKTGTAPVHKKLTR